MRKRLIEIFLTFALLVMALAGCGKGGETTPETDEDTQNPVMNFVGEYYAGRAHMLVGAEGADGAKITIHGGSSAWESTEWTINGKIDTETLTVEYTDAVRKELVYNDSGELDKETVVYEDGKGRVVFNGEDYTITWEDDTEHAADGLVFEFYNEENEEDPGNPEYYKAVTVMEKTEVESICAAARDAYLNEDWDALKDMIRYPITINKTELKDADAFIEYMKDKTVHESDKTAIANESCHDMFFNGQGICLGDGEVWIIDPNYMTDEEPRLEIIGINGIVDR